MASITPILENKTCLITGAGGGVGRGIALAMASAGANVVIAARRKETGEPVAQEIAQRKNNGTFIKCDVTSRDDIKNAVAQTIQTYGQLDCFVHNALSSATKAYGYLEGIEENWQSLCSTALRASFDSAQAAYPELKKSEGVFILVSSSAGVEGSESLPIYGAVKAAQRALGKSLAAEWGPQVRVNMLNPVAVTDAMKNAYKRNPKLKERLEARTPLGYIGDPEYDIGSAAIFLASPLSRYITGQTLSVDGGNFLGL